MELVAEHALAEGCIVAPVGSVYFLYQESGQSHTKDVDLVVHHADLRVADLATLRRLGDSLGAAEPSEDGAVVQVRLPGSPEPHPQIELIRGRGRARRGYLPRPLLEEAARRARREGNILLYPPEFVLVLKADAAVDREERAARDSERAEQNLARAATFRADVVAEAHRLLAGDRLDKDALLVAISHLKKRRRAAVETLLQDAGALG